jgi:hypothetical protein
MIEYECSKHGLVEFTEPDANYNVICRKCRDETIRQYIEGAQPYATLALAMGKHIPFSMGAHVQETLEQETLEQETLETVK